MSSGFREIINIARSMTTVWN